MGRFLNVNVEEELSFLPVVSEEVFFFQDGIFLNIYLILRTNGGIFLIYYGFC